MGSATGLITIPGDDDIDLATLQNFALSISWCSRAVLEVFLEAVLEVLEAVLEFLEEVLEFLELV